MGIGGKELTFWIKERLKLLFGSDVRSLAIFRICLALLILFDLYFRSLHMRAFYTDFGVMPRDVLLTQVASPYNFSLHLLGGSIGYQIILFIIAGVFAGMLLLGYRTRMASIISWIMLVSLQNRNPLALQGGDVLFRMLLFWAMFVPLGNYWSLDAKQGRTGESSKLILKIGTIGLFLQVAFLYWFAGALKTGRDWIPDGTAIYYALSIDQLVSPLGKWMLLHPGLMQALTFIVIYYWFIGPLLLFSPVFTNVIRTSALGIFFFIQLGMMFSIHLGPFPWINFVSLIPLIPGKVWDILGRKFKLLEYKPSNFKPKEKKRWMHTLGIAVFLFGAFCLVYVYAWNLDSIGSYHFPGSMTGFSQVFRIDQRWDMFSPFPLKEDGWYVIPGKLKNGREIDLFRGGEQVNWEKPEDISKMYHTERWRKYMMNLWSSNNRPHFMNYGRYLCRSWNEKHTGEEQLDTFQVYFMLEVTPEPGKEAKIEKVSLWNHSCFK